MASKSAACSHLCAASRKLRKSRSSICGRPGATLSSFPSRRLA